jgi:hypothetical protein
MRKLFAAVLVAGALATAGCATAAPQPAPTNASPVTSSVGLITPLVVGRWAGPGAGQSLWIAADGSWLYTDPKAGISTRGQLTPAQSSALVKLLTDPALVTALADPPSDAAISCPDGRAYTLRFGTSDTFSFLDCGSLPPAVEAVIQELMADTPLTP